MVKHDSETFSVSQPHLGEDFPSQIEFVATDFERGCIIHLALHRGSITG